MDKSQADKIQKDVFEIVNRVKKNGRESEAVRVKLDIMLKGQAAINYKVLKLFASEIKDADLVKLLFKLGIQNGAEMLKSIAPENGIQI